MRHLAPGCPRLIAAVTVAMLSSFPAFAAMTTSPANASGFPTQTTAPITVNLTFGASRLGGTGTITSVGLPAGVTTAPSVITYLFAANSTTASTAFQFAIGATTLPGTYSISLSDASNNAGTATVTLVVNNPSITPRASPNPVTLILGGSAQALNVTTTPDPGFSARSVTYAFSGFPAFINSGASQATSGPIYPPLTFNFSLNAGAVAGTYPGTLTGSYNDPAGALQSRSIPFTVIVQQPDIAASFSNPTVAVCNGGTAVSDTINLTPLAGYSGTPLLNFTPIPPGIIITPVSPTASRMPPGQSVPFTIQASGAAPGTQIVTLNVDDAAAGIKKIINLTVTVNAPDFTPSVSPNLINLVAGGGGQSITAALIPNACFAAATVNVTPGALPPGITFSPTSLTLSAPGYAPAGIVVQASSSVAPGTYPLTVTFTPSGGTPKTTAVTINVSSAPDFSLRVIPPAVSVAAGQSTSVTVSAAGINGFNGAVSVSAPTLPNLTFTPPTFTLTPGGSQIVTINAGSGAPPSTIVGTFNGTAAGITGTRSANVSISIGAAADFQLIVTPSVLAVPQGDSATVAVAATALNGFTGSIAVTSTPGSGITLSPNTFTLVPGTSQNVIVTVNAPIGTAVVMFSGTAPGIAGARTTTLTISVGTRPDFALTVTPASTSISSQGSGNVVVSVAGVNGLSAPVTITGVAPASVTLTPASFTLMPGSTQSVRIDVGAATTGPATVRFTGIAAGLSHTADLLLTILPPRPVITNVAPPGVATGSRSIVLQLNGDFFEPGANVAIANGGVRIENVSVINPRIAQVTLSVRADAAPGAATLTLTNPDGGSAGSMLLVYPSGSIAAPLGVTAAAIVFPAAGTMIAPEQKVFPRGLLATTGTGTIVGVWKFDGAPFDRFIVNAAGGYPAEVRAHVPLPISFAGGHTIELEIESPRHAVSPALEVVMAAASVSRLTLLAPGDGTVIEERPQLFRWSLVPNSSGYLLELDNTPFPLRIRLSESEWSPDPIALQQLGPGIHRWRVRAVFPGETEGEPTEWQRFALLPRHVALVVEPPVIDSATRRTLIRWRGGVAGLLYRIEFISPNGQTIFSALTAASEYAVPASITLPPGTSIRVTAFGPGGSTLGVSPPIILARRSMSNSILLVQQRPAVTSQQPADGSKITTNQPSIGANWGGTIKPEDVSLMLDQTDVTAVSTRTQSSIIYDSLIPLGAGAHTVSLSLGGDLTMWTFEVTEASAAPAPQPTAPSAAAPSAAPQKEKGPSTFHSDWAVTPLGTLTVIHGNGPDEKDDARAQVSMQTDLSNASASAKMTSDISVKHALNDPHKTVQESRNWVTQFGGHQGPYEEEAKIGYAAPDFLDQSELLTTGLARGGVEGRIHFPFVIASAYETFGTRPAGVVAGNFGPQQTVRAVALQTPSNPKWDLRLIGFSVTDQPGFNSAGGTGKAFGIFGRYVASPKLTLLLESAHGNFDPNPESAEKNRSGSALRIGLSGAAGTLSYILNVRRTQSGFINPANRGFTPGGVPDRTGGNLSVTKVINRTSLSLELRHLRDGNSSGAILPKNRESGGNITVATTLGQRTTLSVGANWTGDRGEGNPNLLLPKLDRQQSGVNGTLAEAIGRFSLSQTVTVQKLRDRVNSISDQTITGTTFSFGGDMIKNVNLTAVLAGTRSAGTAAVGTNDQLLASLQPTFTVPAVSVTFQPRAMITRSKNDLTNLESRSEQYEGLVSWAPQAHTAVSVQLSAGANRNRFSGEIVPAKFARRYVGTLSWSWGAGKGAAANGTTVVTAPADPATAKLNDPSTTSSISH